MKNLLDIKDGFSKDQPILLLDADEVLLRFVERLEQFLLTVGFELRLESFQLAGNIYNVETGEKAPGRDVGGLIAQFFDACAHDVPAVDHAADSLKELESHFQIAVLSNVPDHCRERRAESLKEMGIPYPVLANSGEKGPAVKEIADWSNAEVLFVDDLPPQLSSVAQHSPETYRVHFIADPRLAAMLGKAPDAHVRIDCWRELKDHLLTRI